jgi:1,4-dihydroxy-2-naphthoyl-CoA synthase
VYTHVLVLVVRTAGALVACVGADAAAAGRQVLELICVVLMASGFATFRRTGAGSGFVGMQFVEVRARVTSGTGFAAAMTVL